VSNLPDAPAAGAATTAGRAIHLHFLAIPADGQEER